MFDGGEAAAARSDTSGVEPGEPARAPTAPSPVPAAEERPRPGRFGLSSKLLLLTIVFVMVSEVLVYVPSIANFRNNRLAERIRAAELIAISLSGSADVPRAIQDRLLETMGAMTIAVHAGPTRRLVAMAEMPPTIDAVSDLSDRNAWTSISEAFEALLARDGRVLRILGAPNDYGEAIEVVVSETPIRQSMLRYSTNLLGISLIISMTTAALVFFALRHLFVAPLTRITRAMAEFSASPEDPSHIIVPSKRRDELGDAERRLAGMQRELAETLGQKKHLADLGLAVSKINHDLRNMLASAQLLTDRLTAIPDLAVQRFAPKLVATLDRAIGYSQAVLNYGKTGEAPPERRVVSARRLIDDVAEVLGLPSHPTVAFEATVPADLEIDADPDQLSRVLVNLCRNALQALEGDHDPAVVRRIMVEASRSGSVVTLRVADTGPGVPARARANLFRPFQGGVRRGGTGLGLAICAELVRAHGGTIELVEDGPGAMFEIQIPDRVIEIARLPRRTLSRG